MSKYSVKDLAQFLKKSKESGSPFVLFTGAGCSKSAGIPLAGELVDEINRDFELELKGLSKEDRQDYGKCMSVLVKEDRRKLISNYINGAKINWTHIAIALLIEKGYFQRILTFNFDNLLARSSGLLGLYPATYDLTTADLDLHNLIVEPAVVHIHGQSHGFTLLNTDEETSKHAENLEHFIASTLNNSPTLFVGYSGCADAFFPILEKKYTGQHRLFWSGRAEDSPEHLNNSLLKNYGSFAHYIRGEDSDIFFIELARELGCFPPKIFTDPYKHLLNELSHVTDFPVHETTHTDIFVNIKKQLKRDSERYLKQSTIHSEKLLLEGNYDKLISLYESNRSQNKNVLNDVSLAYFHKAYKLQHSVESKDIHEVLDDVITLYENALAINPNLSFAHNNLGALNGDLAKQTFSNNEALELHNRAIEKYKMAIEVEPKMALSNQNLLLAYSEIGDVAAHLDLDASIYFRLACEHASSILPIIENDSHLLHCFSYVIHRFNQVSNEHDFISPILNELILYLEKMNNKVQNDLDILGALGLLYITKFSMNSDNKNIELAMSYMKIVETIDEFNIYDMGCAFALTNQLEKCREIFEKMNNAGKLQNKKHLLIDKDLEVIRELDWFKNIMSD